jgi:hypothetical protein
MKQPAKKLDTNVGSVLIISDFYGSCPSPTTWGTRAAHPDDPVLAHSVSCSEPVGGASGRAKVARRRCRARQPATACAPRSPFRGDTAGRVATTHASCWRSCRAGGDPACGSITPGESAVGGAWNQPDDRQGGSVTSAELSCPCHGVGAASTPPAFPTFDPPYCAESVLSISTQWPGRGSPRR